MEAWHQPLQHRSASSSRLSVKGSRICLRTPPKRLNNHPIGCWPSLLRPPIAVSAGTGILTCFPSTTHFCLALGADSPYADERCVGNLALTARGLFTPFNATHVSIRTSDTSSIRYQTPSTAYRTLSYHMCKHISAISVHSLSPVTSSAQDDSTSELLRFL